MTRALSILRLLLRQRRASDFHSQLKMHSKPGNNTTHTPSGSIHDNDIDAHSTSTAFSSASRGKGAKFYAVRTGFNPGIYHTYPDCLDQIRGFKNPMFKTFSNLEEAKAFLVAPLTSAGASTPVESDGFVTKYYAVRHGRVPGVYPDWPSAQKQIIGWSKPRHKAFYSREEAEEFVNAEVEPMHTGANSVAGSTSTIGAAHRRGELGGAGGGGSNGNVNTDSGAPASKKRKISTADMPTGSSSSLHNAPDGAVARAADGSGVAKSKSRSAISAASTIIAPPSIPSQAPGSAALPPDAEDGFDNRIVMDPETGKLRYKTTEEMTQTKLAPTGVIKTGTIDIYTDGSSRKNGRIGAVAGVGVYFGPGDSRNISERLPGSRQTNQRAELQAILRALDLAPIHNHVRIFTDSQYSIKCVTEWYKKWQENGWTRSTTNDFWKKSKGRGDGGAGANARRGSSSSIRASEDGNGNGSNDTTTNGAVTGTGKPVENVDLIRSIRERIEERELAGAQTGFFWVKGHSSIPGNVEADRLAVQGATKPPRPVATGAKTGAATGAERKAFSPPSVVASSPTSQSLSHFNLGAKNAHQGSATTTTTTTTAAVAVAAVKNESDTDRTAAGDIDRNESGEDIKRASSVSTIGTGAGSGAKRKRVGKLGGDGDDGGLQ